MHIEAINLRERWAVFGDGTRADVWLLDIDHERTNDLAQAVTFVVYQPITPDGPFWLEAEVGAVPRWTVH